MDIKFGTDGWRAPFADGYTFPAVRRLAAAVANYVCSDPTRDDRVVVGYDRRFVSELFARHSAEVLAQHGIDVRLSDRATPTQLMSFAARESSCLAMVITASHNPYTDNGVKIKERTGAPADSDTLSAIERLVPNEDPQRATQDYVATVDLTPRYRAALRAAVAIEHIASTPLTVVVDALHGCGAGWLQELLPDDSALQIIAIGDNRDPYFGGLNPEPVHPHTNRLITAVREHHANLGIAFDGDADRVALVTNSGKLVSQLDLLSLLYLHFLEDRKELGPAVYTISSSDMIPRIAAQYGTEAYQTRVGFKYVGPKMLEVGAVIGGEESGGYGYSFHLPERDGILSALLLLEMVVQRGLDVDQILHDLQSRFGPSHYDRVDLRFDRSTYEKTKNDTLRGLSERLRSDTSVTSTLGIEWQGVDGMKLRHSQGWLLMRFSGTEPVLRLYSEMTSEEGVQEMLELGRHLVASDHTSRKEWAGG